MTQVRLIDPSLGEHRPDRHEINAVIVPELQSLGLDPLVAKGQIIDVPDSVAGKGPQWRPPAPGDDLPWLVSGGLVKRDESGAITDVYDLGSGLLSQVTMWEPVKKTKKVED